VTYMRIPVKDQDIPSPATMKIILDTIDAALAQNRLVYLRCWGGRGRTGTIVGRNLARPGRATEEGTLARIAALRKDGRTQDLALPQERASADHGAPVGARAVKASAGLRGPGQAWRGGQRVAVGVVGLFGGPEQRKLPRGPLAAWAGLLGWSGNQHRGAGYPRKRELSVPGQY